MENILIILLRFFPELISVVALWIFVRRILFFKKAVRTFGEVTGIEERKHRGVSGNTWGNRIVFHPVIHFEDKTGKRYRCVVGMLGRFMSYNTGDIVPLLYKESNPLHALVNNFFIIWTLPALLLSGGIFCLFWKYAA